MKDPRSSRFLPLHWKVCWAGSSPAQRSATYRLSLCRLLLNWWPAARGAGLHVSYVAPAMREIHVSLAELAHA